MLKDKHKFNIVKQNIFQGYGICSDQMLSDVRKNVVSVREYHASCA